MLCPGEREVSEHQPSSIQSRLAASGRVRVQGSASNAASGRDIPPLMSAAKRQSLERYHPTKRKQQLQVGLSQDTASDAPPHMPKSAKASGSDLRELLKRRQLHESASGGNANNDGNDRSRGGQKRRHSRMKNV